MVRKKRMVKNISSYGDVKKLTDEGNWFLGFLSNGWASVLVFLFGIYLLTPTVTGNAIGSFSLSFTNVLGIVLIVLAIGGHYFLNKFLNTYL